MNNLKIDIERGKKAAATLYDRFNSGEGIFDINTMPEDILWASDLPETAVHKGSYEHLMFITMVVSIDYMRNADKLWAAGRKSMEDPKTRWLFNPREVIEKPMEEIKAAMKTHSLSQKHNKDADTWMRVSESFVRIYNSDPRNLIRECGNDALNLYEKKFDIKFRSGFPFLSGDKIFPLWIRMLHDNVGIELKRLECIPIPVDVHIARATFTIGCLKGEYEGSIADVKPRIQEAWKTVMESLIHPRLKYALQMDESLWHLSKYGCRFRKWNICEKRKSCPVGSLCVSGKVHVSAKRIEIRTGDSNDKTPFDNFMLQ